MSDINDFEQSMQQQEKVVDILFSTITYIVMLLCYFSLVSAMTANIYEQTKEITVYRALGITKALMINIYKYEAFVLVFTNSLMGLIVGTLIGFIMTMQRGLFTDLPLTFLFPLQNFIVIFIVSILGYILFIILSYYYYIIIFIYLFVQSLILAQDNQLIVL